MAARLGEAQLARLFPAYLAFDRNLSLTAFGPSLRRQLPDLAPGDRMADAFEWPGDLSDAGLRRLVAEAEPIVLVSLCGKVRLSGLLLDGPEGGFVLAARNAPADFLAAINRLQICDFGPDDPLVSGLMLAGLQRAMIEESRAIALDLVRERERSLELLERISRSAAFIAHDFNNFLSIIRLNGERLMRDLAPGGRQARMARMVLQTADRCSEITRSLATLSGQRIDPPAPVALDAVIAENEAFLTSVIGNRNELRLELGAPRAGVGVGRVAFLNCLTNLLMNARDAMPEGGRVTIATSVRTVDLEPVAPRILPGPRSYYAIEVADSGAGMPSDALARAFEPLFSTKRHGGGLGLASVLELVREAGGDACATSAGSGSTAILLYLPLFCPPEEASEPEPAAEPARKAGALRVVLVEDEPYALEALADMLDAEGMVVWPCANAASALDALGQGRCDVLLTDVVMPGMDGIALARRAEALVPGIRIVLMSGQMPDEQEIDPGWHFIRKPLDTRTLVQRLHAPAG